MVGIKLHGESKTRYLPTALSQCDRQQARDVSHALFAYMGGDIPLNQLNTQIVCAVLNLRKTTTKNTDTINENLFRLSELLTGFYEHSDDGKLKVLAQFDDNPFPWLRPMLTKYYGPKQIFENINFGQYVDALDPFADFADTGDMIFLDTLLAILFVPSVTLSRKHKHHSPKAIKQRARTFRSLDIGYKFGFYLYFASFQEYLQSAKVYREGRELDLSILFKPLPGEDTAVPSDLPGLGMLSLQYAMAQSGIFGDNDRLRAQPFWNIIPRMYDMRKEDYDKAMAHKKANQ